MNTDFIVTDQGSVVGLTPNTEQARVWLDENVQSEGWQWLGHTLWIDHRMAENILAGVTDEGLTIGGQS